MVSLPADASRMTPQAARGAAASRTPAIAVRLPSPSACRLGSANPPAARARLPSVSAPASPYSAASGAPPQPAPSATMMIARLNPVTRREYIASPFGDGDGDGGVLDGGRRR